MEHFKPCDLDELIKEYRDASSQLEKAIAQSGDRNLQAIIGIDKKLSSTFEKILELELESEQRLARIDFLSELLLRNYANEEALGSELIATIRSDSKNLLEIARA
ncbi:MAG: hypothetical protein ABJ375_04760 [Rhizobiaceae bacterium]